MANIGNLIGLGMHPFLARAITGSIREVTAGGASLASATQIPNDAGVAYVIATNSGSGLKLPAITGDNGVLLNTRVVVFNFLGAGIQVYASNSCTITGSGASASGDTGVSVATCNGLEFWPITTTSWIYSKFGSA